VPRICHFEGGQDVSALAIAAGILFALGFARYELPAAADRYRRKLERERIEREAKALARERVQAALALAIDKKWREFGCASGLSEAESLALQEHSRSTWPPRLGSGISISERIPRRVSSGYSAKRHVNPATVRPPKGGTAVRPAPNPTRPSKRWM